MKKEHGEMNVELIACQAEIERLRSIVNNYRLGKHWKGDEIDEIIAENERLRSREFEALGWMYAELCNRVDAGEDIRRVEVPELIAAYEALQEGEAK